MIANHYAGTLSKLDNMIVSSVPPGGNWKNVPESVPSKRIQQIRISYAEGKGSRSTYYGRLNANAPSYTINTYFNRPGNGCHIHYDYEGGQHRTLSQREAARLQSFPDNFLFYGSKGAINTQIGNAVPPILAYQIAESIPFKGQFIDLFSGAGGLSLGFIWSGWKPIVANDIEKYALETYSANIHSRVICGDIKEDSIIESIVEYAEKAKKENPDLPLYILGGPPCQGFSTAGKKRSMEDDRNWLFKQYKKVIQKVNPDGFIFENVTGLLSMERGKVFEMIKEELESTGQNITTWKVQAENYGVPQRRTRVFMLGSKAESISLNCPTPITQYNKQVDLFDEYHRAISVEEALSDLPPLEAGEDGSNKAYLTPPITSYQKLMRGEINVDTYINELKSQEELPV